MSVGWKDGLQCRRERAPKLSSVCVRAWVSRAGVFVEFPSVHEHASAFQRLANIRFMHEHA
eukprot:gene12267-13981_t